MLFGLEMHQAIYDGVLEATVRQSIAVGGYMKHGACFFHKCDGPYELYPHGCRPLFFGEFNLDSQFGQPMSSPLPHRINHVSCCQLPQACALRLDLQTMPCGDMPGSSENFVNHPGLGACFLHK